LTKVFFYYLTRKFLLYRKVFLNVGILKPFVIIWRCKDHVLRRTRADLKQCFKFLLISNQNQYIKASTLVKLPNKIFSSTGLVFLELWSFHGSSFAGHSHHNSHPLLCSGQPGRFQARCVRLISSSNI
jgi:hypothetical protein